jgi:ABC-type transporter Mla MlaB component
MPNLILTAVQAINDCDAVPTEADQDMAGIWKDFALQEDFMPAQDSGIQSFLKENSGFSVRIDAGNLRRVDTMLVELLLSAAASWRKRGLGFQLTRVSEANERVLVHLGITPNLLERGHLA